MNISLYFIDPHFDSFQVNVTNISFATIQIPEHWSRGAGSCNVFHLVTNVSISRRTSPRKHHRRYDREIVRITNARDRHYGDVTELACVAVSPANEHKADNSLEAELTSYAYPATRGIAFASLNSYSVFPAVIRLTSSSVSLSLSISFVLCPAGLSRRW